jgi:hypothetical protein
MPNREKHVAATRVRAKGSSAKGNRTEMSTQTLILTVLAMGAIVPLPAQDALTFHIGGGITTPLNQTARYAGTSGNFAAGVGYKMTKRSAMIGEFMWAGLPPNFSVLHPVNAPFGSVNLYTLTANYRYDMDRIHNSRFGLYAIVGGGWYYRYAKIDKNYVVPPGTACQPIYTWWGYSCDPNGFVFTQTVAYKGTSVGGVNGGMGFTIGLGDSQWKFYTEARYHYAFNSTIPSTLIPVTFGIRFN